MRGTNPRFFHLTWFLIPFRWFGLILLPFVSFSADGVNVIVETLVAILKYCCEPKETEEGSNNTSVTLGSASVGSKRTKRKFAMWNNPLLTSEFAHGRPIDMSIQFTLCWTPLLVLFGWWFDKPMHLLFGMLFRVRTMYDLNGLTHTLVP